MMKLWTARIEVGLNCLIYNGTELILETGNTTLTTEGEAMGGIMQQQPDGHPYNWPDPFNEVLMLPGDQFPDFEWAANFDFTNLNWTPTTFNGQ